MEHTDLARDPVEDYPLHGVSLTAYAAVTAARAEGFALPLVLEVERIPEQAFARAEPKWEKRLEMSAAAGGALLRRYQDLRAAAEDQLTRPVPPLDAEIGAWVAFLTGYASAADAEGFLAQHGIGPADLSRLSRLWKGRMVADPSLHDRIRALPARMEVPRILPVAPVLRRFRPSEAAPVDDRAPGAGRAEAPPFDFERCATLSAELEVFPGEATRIHAKLGLGSPSAAEHLAGDLRVALAADARGVDAYRRARATALAGARGLTRPSAADAPPDHEGPGLPSFLSQGPFRPPAPSFALVEAPVPATPAPAPASTPPPAPASPAPLPVAVEAGRTLDVSAVLGASLPFAPATSPESVLRSIEKVEAQQRTSPVVAFAPMGTGGPPRAQPRPAARSTWGPSSPRPPSPFATPAPPAAGAAPVVKVASTPPPPVAPKLTLVQYASLTVDLAAQPARRGETLLRYRITEADLVVLHAENQAHFAAHPPARAAFDQATATYRAWLSANRRG